jgi:signal peptidase I
MTTLTSPAAVTTSTEPGTTVRLPAGLTLVARRIARLAGWAVVIAGGLLLLVPVLLGLDRYVIVGGSMSPTIDRGSVVFAEDVPASELVVGDVITYVPPPESGTTQLVTHRIVDIAVGDDGMRTFRTKGDANDSVDPWTFQLAAERQNRVRTSVPFVGHLLLLLASPRNRILVIGIPAAFVASRALLDLVAAARTRRATA